MNIRYYINPRTYKQIHTPTMVQGGGGTGWMEPIPRVFDMLQYFVTIFYLWWKAFHLLYKMRYILWVVVLLGACDVTNNGCHLGCNLGFYHGLEIRLKL